MRRVLQAADESNIPFLASALTFDALLAAVPFVLLLLVGLTLLVQYLAGGPEVGPTYLFHTFFPPHSSDEADPFRVVENLFVGIAENRGQLSLVAIPTFIWFSTRLFAGIRTALNDVFDVTLRPTRRRGGVVGFISGYLRAKGRDVAMVVACLLLVVANTALTTGFTYLQSRGAAVVERELPALSFFVSAAGRWSGEVLTLLFSVALFFIIYKYASIRRLPWRTALLAAVFAAVAFELAKRLFALYLANFASLRAAAGDANIGALILFVLWIYYTALVFLLGGVVAETWELRKMQRRQRAILE